MCPTHRGSYTTNVHPMTVGTLFDCVMDLGAAAEGLADKAQWLGSGQMNDHLWTVVIFLCLQNRLCRYRPGVSGCLGRGTG